MAFMDRADPIGPPEGQGAPRWFGPRMLSSQLVADTGQENPRAELPALSGSRLGREVDAHHGRHDQERRASDPRHTSAAASARRARSLVRLVRCGLHVKPLSGSAASWSGGGKACCRSRLGDASGESRAEVRITVRTSRRTAPEGFHHMSDRAAMVSAPRASLGTETPRRNPGGRGGTPDGRIGRSVVRLCSCSCLSLGAAWPGGPNPEGQGAGPGACRRGGRLRRLRAGIGWRVIS
jgi:hypothetical protein